jgi:hypothetical protein
MGRYTPYIQRRGFGLSFRLSVPLDLRSLVGMREITLALPTVNRSHATYLALECAAYAKRMFRELRVAMAEKGDFAGKTLAIDLVKLKELVQATRHKIRLATLESEHEAELFEQRRLHIYELKLAQLEAENTAYLRAMSQIGLGATPTSVAVPAPALAPASVVEPSKRKITPTFKVVVDDFLNGYKKNKKPEMYKKLRPVLTMLLELVGDKPISDIKQTDINDFFDLLGNLPPRWSDECRKHNLTIRQLAKLEHPKILGPKTFSDTYLASVRPFLVHARRNWQDQGFPTGLSTEGIEYGGDREEGENKQRAMNPNELKRLFEGVEMQEFARDTTTAHCFWLPHIGLFTGARVNEICQINPQTDILKEDESGIWYFWITKDTPADDGVVKTIKTGDSRKVPIHDKLIELGFIEYVKQLKKTGAKRLFPSWEPKNKRASGNAEKWFRILLRDLDLRDESPKSTLTGMHAFRHTLLSYGAARKPPLDLFCITGHVQGATPIAATGAGRGYLTHSITSPLSDKAAVLNLLSYDLTFFTPVAS